MAADQRGAKVKKKLEIDPLHADTIRLIYRLALEGDGTSGPMGVKNITAHLNRHHIFTRDGGRWGIGQVHRILTRRTYVGEHEFNKRSKAKALKPVSEVVTVAVPPIIDQVRRRHGAQQDSEGRFRRPRFAGQDQDRIGAAVAQSRQQKRHDKHKIGLARGVDKGSQFVEGTARHRDRKRPHACRPPEPHRRLGDDAPAVRVCFDGAPFCIAEVEIDAPAMPGHAHVHRKLGTVENRLRLDDPQRRGQRLTVGRAAPVRIKKALQPPLEAAALHRPGLAMAVDDEIRVSFLILIMEQASALRQPQQRVGLAFVALDNRCAGNIDCAAFVRRAAVRRHHVFGHFKTSEDWPPLRLRERQPANHLRRNRRGRG
ncbi:MAG: recombinase family protein [Stellaceae bacterium]